MRRWGTRNQNTRITPIGKRTKCGGLRHTRKTSLPNQKAWPGKYSKANKSITKGWDLKRWRGKGSGGGNFYCTENSENCSHGISPTTLEKRGRKSDFFERKSHFESRNLCHGVVGSIKARIQTEGYGRASGVIVQFKGGQESKALIFACLK